MNTSFKSLLFLLGYVVICLGILVLAKRESSPQPVGLLLVAMATTPLIISICGGLPTDCIKRLNWLNI